MLVKPQPWRWTVGGLLSHRRWLAHPVAFQGIASQRQHMVLTAVLTSSSSAFLSPCVPLLSPALGTGGQVNVEEWGRFRGNKGRWGKTHISQESTAHCRTDTRTACGFHGSLGNAGQEHATGTAGQHAHQPEPTLVPGAGPCTESPLGVCEACGQKSICGPHCNNLGAAPPRNVHPLSVCSEEDKNWYDFLFPFLKKTPF